MILPFEVALPLGALAFWIYDIALGLHDNELIFHRAGRRWSAEVGGDWVLFRRRLCVPVPWAPWASVLRSHWSIPPRAQDPPSDWLPPEFERALLPFRILCTALLILLTLALPIASLAFGSGLVLLAVFLAYYGLVLVMLAWLFPRRARVGLTTKAYWALALDVFACAPFAANLVRRLTLRRALTGDALAYAAAHLPPDACEALRARVHAR